MVLKSRSQAPNPCAPGQASLLMWWARKGWVSGTDCRAGRKCSFLLFLSLQMDIYISIHIFFFSLGGKVCEKLSVPLKAEISGIILTGAGSSAVWANSPHFPLLMGRDWLGAHKIRATRAWLCSCQDDFWPADQFSSSIYWGFEFKNLPETSHLSAFFPISPQLAIDRGKGLVVLRPTEQRGDLSPLLSPSPCSKWAAVASQNVISLLLYIPKALKELCHHSGHDLVPFKCLEVVLQSLKM